MVSVCTQERGTLGLLHARASSAASPSLGSQSHTETKDLIHPTSTPLALEDKHSGPRPISQGGAHGLAQMPRCHSGQPSAKAQEGRQAGAQCCPPCSHLLHGPTSHPEAANSPDSQARLREGKDDDPKGSCACVYALQSPEGTRPGGDRLT